MTCTSIPLRQSQQKRNIGWFSRLLGARQLHKERKALSRMSDHRLNDIGLTRSQANAEAKRSFWPAPQHWKR